ncbi:uncharacterized protein LOC134468234 [Engraulis encrasicolus]|uniref:uncharacterized protein LOC134468234 n=1 Tax=Engraulis encrasicolus TaxID=184585 RepID=UPI002FD3AF9A
MDRPAGQVLRCFLKMGGTARLHLQPCPLIPGGGEFCYHLPSCNDAQWPTLFPDYCDKSRQSPIDIVSTSAVEDSGLGAFTLSGYDDTTAMSKITNSKGKTVKVDLNSGKASMSGGGLSESYDALQFHLHWGNGSEVGGSEHTVDGKRFPMELHIVHVKGSLNLNTTLAVADGTGLAVLGFFIEVDSSTTDEPAGWLSLASQLQKITLKDESVSFSGISLNDLITGVDLTKYYRYLGSLTTPACNEAVVWTVFKEPVKVSKNLIDLFSNSVRIGDTTASELMTNVFRNVQSLNGRQVSQSPTSSPVIDAPVWPTVFAAYCNGNRQSPVDIVSNDTVLDLNLEKFTFSGFDNTAAMSKIKNTGKTVKVEFNSGLLSVSGGNLSETYDTLQFHIHWGNTSAVPGSEHTVDGKQYPMELHIVNAKSSLGGNVTSIVQDGTGLAALGFFIEVDSNSTDEPASWKTLTSHLPTITEKNSYTNITGISMNDLINGVDLTKYFRYLGSLTTPDCNEAVVWTVFEEPIKVSKNLVDLFSTTVLIDKSGSPLAVNTFRPVQALNDRTVFRSAAESTARISLPLLLAALYALLRLA